MLPDTFLPVLPMRPLSGQRGQNSKNILCLANAFALENAPAIFHTDTSLSTSLDLNFARMAGVPKCRKRFPIRISDFLGNSTPQAIPGRHFRCDRHAGAGTKLANRVEPSLLYRAIAPLLVVMTSRKSEALLGYPYP